jgi:hypothetical protein
LRPFGHTMQIGQFVYRHMIISALGCLRYAMEPSVLPTFPSDFPQHPEVFAGLLRIDVRLFHVRQLLSISTVLLHIHAPIVVA